jgi:hypothetical protein
MILGHDTALNDVSCEDGEATAADTNNNSLERCVM